MKYLYSLLLFISCNHYETVYAQITITNNGFVSSTTQASSISQSFNMIGGRLYLVVISTTGTNNAGTVSSSTGHTWTQVVSIGNNTQRLQIFRHLALADYSGADITIGSFGTNKTGSFTGILEMSGVPTTGTNGADAIVQAVTSSGTGAPNPTLNLPTPISQPRNALLFLVVNNVNPFNGTPESGFTEVFDGGYDTPNSGAYLMTQLNANDNSPTVTAGASDYWAVAIELQSLSTRRIIQTN